MSPDPKKDDMYIALIKFVKEKTLETGVMTLKDGTDYLKENDRGITDQTAMHFFTAVAPRDAEIGTSGERQNYRLSINSYFHLLEFEELQEAREPL